MDRELKKLAIAVARKEPAGNYSYDEMHEGLRKEIAKLICDETGKINYHSWQRNKSYVFELVGTMVDEVLPRRVLDTIGQFADVKNFEHGDKPRFYLKTGRQNVRRFVTRVAAAGVYERVRLDRDYFDMEVYAHGGAVYQTLEGFLAGRENISDVYEIMLEGLEDEMYSDISTALIGTMTSMPAANQFTGAGFDESEFIAILSAVRAYGTPVVFCTQEFAGTLAPTDIFVGAADQADMRDQGYLGKVLGADVVVLPNSFTDSTNTETVIDPQYAYIMPAGSSEAPVKVALEGNTLIRDVQREDWSAEIQMYKKMGTSIVHTHHFGIYRNTDL